MALIMYVIGLGLGYILGTENQKRLKRKALGDIKKDNWQLAKETIDRRRDGVPDRVRVYPKPNHVTPFVKAPVTECKPWDGTTKC